MSNKALIYILNTLLITTSCAVSVQADTTPVDPVQIEKLTQSVASSVLMKLEMLDQAKPELQSMSLEKVVTEALHAGKSMDEVREAVSQTMVELTGQPLGQTVAQSEAQKSLEVTEPDAKVESSVVSPDSERAIPLTTVLLPNESLSSVAKRIYGPDQGRRYLDIYELNKAEIPNINVIPEGTVLKLPE